MIALVFAVLVFCGGFVAGAAWNGMFRESRDWLTEESHAAVAGRMLTLMKR